MRYRNELCVFPVTPDIAVAGMQGQRPLLVNSHAPRHTVCPAFTQAQECAPWHDSTSATIWSPALQQHKHHPSNSCTRSGTRGADLLCHAPWSPRSQGPVWGPAPSASPLHPRRWLALASLGAPPALFPNQLLPNISASSMYGDIPDHAMQED